MNQYIKASKLDFDNLLFTISDSSTPPYYSCYCPSCNTGYKCKGQPIFNHIIKQICLDCQGIKDTENYNLKD